MRRKRKKKTTRKNQWQLLAICLTVAILSVVFGSGLKMTLAANWNPPTADPPLGNTPGPIWLNVSTPQDGGFRLKGDSFITDGVLQIDGKNVCLSDGTYCTAAGTLDDVVNNGRTTDDEIASLKLSIGYDLGDELVFDPPLLDAAGKNLIYGLIDAGSSDGNFLLFQKGLDNDKFRVDHDGNIWLAQGNEICFDTGVAGDPSDDDCFSDTSGLSGDFVSLKDRDDIPADWGSPDQGGFWVQNMIRIGDPLDLVDVAEGDNLIHGIFASGSDGNLLKLEESGGPAFNVEVDPSGMIAIRSSANEDMIIDAGDGTTNTVVLHDHLSVSGCFGPVFIGTTTSVYPADFLPGNTGYVSVDNACKTEVDSGSHVCTMQEVLNSINCGWLWTDDTKTILKGFVATARDEAPYPYFRIKVGAPALPVQTNDCAGWESEDVINSSAVWRFDNDGGTGWALPCSDTAYSNYKFACCK